MTGKYGKMSKVDLVKRLAAMEEDLRAQMDMQEILQDLHVHQEEVRVQNEQLIEMKRSPERSRDRYADLYDFAISAALQRALHLDELLVLHPQDRKSTRLNSSHS